MTPTISVNERLDYICYPAAQALLVLLGSDLVVMNEVQGRNMF